MKPAIVAVLLGLSVTSSWAADASRDRADIAARSAQVEMLRTRVGATSSSNAWATLIEAENLLRQLRESPTDKKAITSQLDAALARLELEISTADRR